MALENYRYLNAEIIANTLGNAKRRGDHWQCRCPNAEAHTNGDRNPSFAIKDGDTQPIIVKCFSGCSQEDLIKALKRINLWPAAPKLVDDTVSRIDWNNPLKIYVYRDVNGNYLYEKARYAITEAPYKTFIIRRKDALSGKYIYKDATRGINRVLYKLPEAAQAANKGERLFIVEGEKDCDTLFEYGFIATTSDAGGGLHGRGKWPASCNSHLKGADIYIIPDNDEAGMQHAQGVALSLYNSGINCKIMELPGLEAKGDVTDWFEAGATPEMLIELTKEITYWNPISQIKTVTNLSETAPIDQEELSRHLGVAPPVDSAPIKTDGNVLYLPGVTDLRRLPIFTDVANGERFVAQHGELVKYTPQSSWFWFNGMRYVQDEDSILVKEMAKRTARSLEDIPVQGAELTAYKYRWINKSLSVSGYNNMLKAASSHPAVTATLSQFDSNGYLINTSSGVVDLRDGKLYEHNKSYMCTKIIHPDIKYDLNAECPRFLQFLMEIMDGDWDMIRFLQRLFGYCLIGKIREHIAPFFYGGGGNGKTTLLELMLKIFWMYGYASGAEMWMRRATRDNMENLIHLMGRRLITAGEIDSGDRLDENRVKNCTGGDTVRGRDLYAKPIEFKFEGKIIFFGNHKPRITDMGKGIWRRVLLIPFDVTITKPDDNLSDELWKECDGVFLWLIQGAMGYQYYGLCPPARVKAETEKYKYEQDTIGQFIEEICITGEGHSCYVMKLYRGYASWCQSRGQIPKSQPQFSAELLNRSGIAKLEKRFEGGFKYVGISLLTQDIQVGGQPYRDD